jgi:nicotinamidase-related amidase
MRKGGAAALLLIDFQRYYFDPDADFFRYYSRNYLGSMDYISQRIHTTALPNLSKILQRSREAGIPSIFIRLCGNREDRSDLHPAFQRAHQEAVLHGVKNLYPLSKDPMADFPAVLAPAEQELVWDKTTFSAFTSPGFGLLLESKGLRKLYFTGLATSQCVESTARDAVDRGFEVVFIEDALADYDEATHQASLFSSRGMCGGQIISTEEYLTLLGTDPKF